MKYKDVWLGLAIFMMILGLKLYEQMPDQWLVHKSGTLWTQGVCRLGYVLGFITVLLLPILSLKPMTLGVIALLWLVVPPLMNNAAISWRLIPPCTILMLLSLDIP
uniref:Uncharacterized protein n=1 Tax=viral metagenome TaxID=1070528 RepID=A0A6C0BNR8_9ZZZZ